MGSLIDLLNVEITLQQCPYRQGDTLYAYTTLPKFFYLDVNPLQVLTILIASCVDFLVYTSLQQTGLMLAQSPSLDTHHRQLTYQIPLPLNQLVSRGHNQSFAPSNEQQPFHENG